MVWLIVHAGLLIPCLYTFLSMRALFITEGKEAYKVTATANMVVQTQTAKTTDGHSEPAHGRVILDRA